LPPGDASLARTSQSTYERRADGKLLPVVLRSAARCNAGIFDCEKMPAPFRILPCQREPRGGSQGAVSGPSGVRSRALVSGDGLKTRHNQISASPRREPADRSGAPFGASRAVSNRQGGMCCRQRVQTGRRLMRQTVLRIIIPGRFASMRSQGFVRRGDRTGIRSARRPGLRFGLPLTPESGGPSRLPAAQPAPRVRRARRHQEFKNAKQNVDRCHSPGRDPGRCGPWQSRRRV